MTWVFIAAATVFVAIGVAVLINPEGWSTAIRSSQQRRLGPWARPDDQIDDRGLFGAEKPAMRVASMRIVGLVFIAVSIGSALTAIFAS